MFTGNDPDAVRRMYTTEEALRIRQMTHDQYSETRVSIADWALSNIQWRGDEQILDVGCGPGRWSTAVQNKLPDVKYYGFDLYPKMMQTHPLPEHIAVADAQRIPFADGAFDLLMANHMLFHVPDVERAMREFRRVLKPGGVIMATTNSVQNLPEIQALMRRAITLLVPPGTTNIRVPPQHTDLFTLESGTRLLSRYFFAVVRYDLPGKLVFTSADPLLAYIESTRSIREAELPAGVMWDDMMMIVREQIGRLIEHFGELTINKLSGLLVATDRGDFIHDYLDHMANNREKTKPTRPKKKRKH
ncbi:MAG: class I SAM-dependent methyltransferase [Anaerolineae bacterium]